MSNIHNAFELYKMHRKEMRRLRPEVMRFMVSRFLRPKIALRFLLIAGAASTIIFLLAAMMNRDEKYTSLLAASLTPKSHKEPKTIVIADSAKSHNRFLHDLAIYESSGKYDVVKTAGDYWGRYQIGPIARQALGISSTIRRDEFLANHALQDGMVTALMHLNKRHLAPYIGQYEGRTIAGIYITQSGLLAGAHLGGASSVVKWLETGGQADFADGNGTKISKYIKRFAGYKLKL